VSARAQPRLLLDPVSSGQPLRARVSGAVKMALRGVGVEGQPGVQLAWGLCPCVCACVRL